MRACSILSLHLGCSITVHSRRFPPRHTRPGLCFQTLSQVRPRISASRPAKSHFDKTARISSDQRGCAPRHTRRRPRRTDRPLSRSRCTGTGPGCRTLCLALEEEPRYMCCMNKYKWSPDTKFCIHDMSSDRRSRP